MSARKDRWDGRKLGELGSEPAEILNCLRVLIFGLAPLARRVLKRFLKHGPSPWYMCNSRTEFIL